MKYLFPLFALLLLLVSCRPSTFEAVLNVDQTYDLTFVGDDAFADTISINLEEFRSYFDEVDSTLLKDVFIEGFAIALNTLTSNRTDSVLFSITVHIDSQQYDLFKDVGIAVTVERDNFKGLNQFLQPNSLADLDERFAGIVRGDSVESLVFIARGTAVPGNTFANLRVRFFVRFTAVIEDTQEVPRFIGK